MKKYPQVLKNVRVCDKDIIMNNARVRESVESVEKRLGDKGRILLRPSGTEPLIRVMVEAEEIALCEHCVNEVLATIEKVEK